MYDQILVAQQKLIHITGSHMETCKFLPSRIFFLLLLDKSYIFLHILDSLEKSGQEYAGRFFFFLLKSY